MNNQFEKDEDRRAYEAMLASNAWGKPNGEAMLGRAVLRARERARGDGGILTGEEMIAKLTGPATERARELHKQMLARLLTMKKGI